MTIYEQELPLLLLLVIDKMITEHDNPHSALR